MTRTDLIDGDPINTGEAVKASGVSAKMIRCYESVGLLSPNPHTEDSYHVYDARVLYMLRFTHRSRSLGFVLEEICTLFSLWGDRGWASVNVEVVTLHHMADPGARISELQTVHDTLMTLADTCHGNDHPGCPILQSVTGESGEDGPESDLDTCCR